jgi:hypothetical protein
LQRASGHLFCYAKFVARVSGQGIVPHQLQGNRPGEFWIETTLHVNGSEFPFLSRPLLGQFHFFSSQISPFGISL